MTSRGGDAIPPNALQKMAQLAEKRESAQSLSAAFLSSSQQQPSSQLAPITAAWKKEKERKMAKLQSMRAARIIRVKERAMEKVNWRIG